MSNTTDIAASRYVSVTTFTKDGTPKPTPVWIVGLPDGRLGFTTARDSWKVKRIGNTPGVTLRPCDMRGQVDDGAVEVIGTAALADDGETAQIQSLVEEKYGFIVTVLQAVNKVRRFISRAEAEPDGAVVITVD